MSLSHPSPLGSARPVDFTSEEWEQLLAVVTKAIQAAHQSVRASAYRTPSWELARRLKAHHKLSSVSGEQAAALVDRILADLFDDEPSTVDWNRHLPSRDSSGNDVDPRDDFIVGFDRCREGGAGALAEAFERASMRRLPADYFGEAFSSARDDKLRLFLALAEELQKDRGNRPIFLPREATGRVLGVSKMTISRWMSRSQRLFSECEEPRYGRAARYYFLGASPDNGK